MNVESMFESRKKFTAIQVAVASIVALSAAGIPRQADAADAAEDLEEIVVTGTLIRGAPVVGSTVVAVTQQDIEDAGQTSTADILRQMPFVSLSGASEIASASSSNAANLNTTRLQGINIRGLGVTATLVLLDGRRVAPGGVGGQVFDPSAIPTIALERVEVVPDGASALYGADAVAGVANLILRKNYQGAEIQASYGSADGYSGQQKYSAIAGTHWDGGSIMVAGEFFSHPRLSTSEYPDLYNPNQLAYGGRDQRTLGGAPGNIIVGPTTYGLPAGTGVGVTPAQFSTTPNRTNQSAGSDIIPTLERHSLVLSIQQDINDKIHLWGEGYYSERMGRWFQGPVIQANLQVPSTNPYFIAGASAACRPPLTGQCNTVTYSFANDLPQSYRQYLSQSSQIAAGVDFNLPHEFDLSVYVTNSNDREYDTTYNLLNVAGVNAALALTDPTTALNIVGSGGNNNPSTLATLTGSNLNGSRFTRNVANVKLDGALFNLPGGAAKMALGGEYYQDSLWDISNYGNTGTPNNKLFSTAYQVVTPRNVGSEFLEVLLPFVGKQNAMTGVQNLQVDLAVRHDNYSDIGSTTNPKFGVTFDPTDDLTVKGSYGKSFRAPTLCDTNPICTGTVATRQTADPGFAANNVVTAPPGQSIVAFVVGGNSAIQPETATTYSLGLDLHPRFAKGLDVSVNYFNIDYKNIIDTPAAFNASISTNPYYASLFVRNPTAAQVQAFWTLVPTANPTGGFLPTQVNLLAYGNRQNVGEAKMHGLDIAGNYHWDTSIGAIVAGVTSEYVFHYLYSVVPGAPFVDRLNEINGTSTAFPLRFTARAQLGWNLKGFRANAFVNYKNAYTNIAPPIAPVVPQTIGSYTTVDLTLSYDTQDSFSGPFRNVKVGVDASNLFNRQPPFALIGVTEFDPANSNPLGRLLTLNVSKTF